MKINRRSNLLKKIHSCLTILLSLGFLAALTVQDGYAQRGLSPEADAALGDTPAFIDDSFRPALGGAASTNNRTLVQPDGKILVAGVIHSVNGISKNGIVRFNADGSVDTAFNSKSGVSGTISAMGLQSDGKIIIGGSFTTYGGHAVGNIARLNTDGTIDITFNQSAGLYSERGASSTINAVSVLPDNRIYIGGNFTSYNGATANRLARLGADGNLDPTFAAGTGANSTVQAIAPYAGGKILIGGTFTNYGGTTINRLARVNADGSIDTSLNIGTGPSGTVRSIVVQPDDKILVGGSIATFNTAAKNGLALLNADGSNDSTLAVSGTGATINAIVRQADGKLIVGGVFPAIAGTTRQSIARLNADGSFDATFAAGTGLNPTGTPVGSVNDLALQPDGSVVLVGAFTSYNGASRSGIARAASNGTLDANLAPTTSQIGNLYAITKQTDGKVLIGGQFSAVGGTARSNVARLNPDGSLDNSFDPGTGANGLVESLAVQPDGKIIIGGEFTAYNGTSIKGIARLNANGSLDPSFSVGTGVEGGVLTIALQADGKVLIGGFITTFNSVTVNNIARLNTDGSLDTSLATGTGLNSTVRKIAVQPDGKILVGGDFSTFNGNPKTRLMRINSDGSADAAFNPGTIAGGVHDFVLHADGKIAMVGGFTTVGGVSRNRIARLNPDGSLDVSFNPDAGVAGGNAIAIAATEDGKYLVGGQFTTGGGLPKNRLVRVRANGSIDHKFLSGLGPFGSNTSIRTIVPHNGKYLIGGQFDAYNTSARSSLVRLSNASKAPVDFDGDGKTDYAILRHYGGIGPQTFWINFSSTDSHLGFDFGVFTVDATVPGDYDGDGKTDVALWRGRSAANSPNAYYVIFSSTSTLKGVQFGQDGDRPLVEDYDGDGKDDMAVWRCPPPEAGPGPATWHYMGSLNNPNNTITSVQWGMRYGSQGDQADDVYNGDFDGDGKADFRIQRRVDTSVATLSTPGIFHTLTAKGEMSSEYLGWAGDRIVPGDYNGDGKTDLTISRGFNTTPGTTFWFIQNSGETDFSQIQWGAGGLDQFAQGDYDGDGATDIAVYRRGGENNFYVRRSSDLSLQSFKWGQNDPVCGPACDIAVAAFNNR